MKNIKINYRILLSIWIYLGWFGCIFFAKNNLSLATIVFPIVSWILLKKSFQINQKLIMKLFFLFCVGLLFDFLAIHFDLVQIKTTSQTYEIFPFWLFSLWLMFIISLPLLHSFLQRKYLLALILGSVFGLLSYHSGSQFQVLILNSHLTYLIYAVFWAVYTPVSIYWLNKI